MYKIEVLESDKFDQLPKSITRGSDISNSLGFADPRTKRAYVRHTHIHELNKYLINHELEELMTSKSAHEDENGIRHKSFGDIAHAWFSPISYAAVKSAQNKKKKERQANERQQAMLDQQRSMSIPSFVLPGNQQNDYTPAVPRPSAPGSTSAGGMDVPAMGGLNLGLNSFNINPDILKMKQAGNWAGISF